MGIKIETEHNDIYEFLISKLETLPLTEKEFYERIAKSHLREIPDYYTRLKEIEADSKRNQ
jgi:hypothetical protein